MVDIVSADVRKRMMSNISGKDTKPELLIRSSLHRLGYRYSLHKSGLPGKPDLVLKKHRAIIEVNGCFWHFHGCHLFKWPATRPDFWRQKLTNNAARDAENYKSLIRLGWRVLVVWECALKGTQRLQIDEVVSLIEEWILSDEQFSQIDSRGLSRMELV